MKRNKTWLAWALSVGLVAYLLGAATVGRSTVDAGQVVKAYASGTALHADALQAGLAGPRLADVEAAFSAANADSSGFAAASRQNENQVFVQPTDIGFAGKNASARGSGVELGLGDSTPTEAGNIVSLNKANAVAPPDSVDTQDVTLPAAPPLLYASLLHGDALARWQAQTCLTTATTPIAYGRGYNADLELLDAGTTAPDGSLGSPVVATDDSDPNRNALTTWSFTYAEPNGVANHYGLVSEIHQTYAPVEVAQDPLTGGTIEIEVLGEWFVKAVADGINKATIEWGVTDPVTGDPIDPTDTVIRISIAGSEVLALSLNDIAGTEGLEVPLNPVLNAMLGEDIRAISAPGGDADPTSSPTLAANGTRAAGAMDVVRLNVLDVIPMGLSVADLRIGHFETDLQVPAGGFTCTPPTTTTTTTTSTTTTTIAPTSTSTTSTSTTSTSTTTTSSTSTTSTTAAPTSSTSTSTTIAPSTSTTAPPTTTTTAPPPQAPIALPIRVQPKTVG